MNLRLFTGLRLPDMLAERLPVMQRGVPGASWRSVESFHITLAFHGEVDNAKARDLHFELTQVRIAPFEVRLQGPGWFGNAEPHSLFMGVTPTDQISRLAGQCERAARRAGIAIEARRYSPHVTLAYLRGTPAKECVAFCQKLNLYRSEPFLVEEFALFSSHSGRGPSRYEEQAWYSLVAPKPAPGLPKEPKLG
jgi:2'-5' RNA ligase